MAHRYFYEVTFHDGSTQRYIAENEQEALEKAKAEVLPEYQKDLKVRLYSSGPVQTKQVGS